MTDDRTMAARLGRALGAVWLGGLLALACGGPQDARAADPTQPPCSVRYPSPGPAGVDLEAACLTNEIVDTYTSTEPARPDGLERAVLAIVAGGLAGAGALAVWDVARRRAGRRMAASRPSAYWLCECRSYNPSDRAACYSCRRPRSADARLVDASEPPALEQRFGHPWLGRDEPVDPRSGPSRR